MLRAEIETLTAAYHANPSRRRSGCCCALRHLAGIRLLDDARRRRRSSPPPTRRPCRRATRCPRSPASELTAGLLRAGILRDGCLLVRGLVPRDDALRLAEEIDRAFGERERHEAGSPVTEGYYEEFGPHTRFGPVVGRGWIEQGGGVLAADSPKLNFAMMELFRAAALPRLASEYLGEPALISVHKTTLRKADPVGPRRLASGWLLHGREVRSLNLWLSLSRCGDALPGLDIVPRRLDQYVATATEEAVLDYTISQQKAEEAAGETRSSGRSSSPATRCCSTSCSCTRPVRIRRCPIRATRSRTGSSGLRVFPDEYAPIAV